MNKHICTSINPIYNFFLEFYVSYKKLSRMILALTNN